MGDSGIRWTPAIRNGKTGQNDRSATIKLSIISTGFRGTMNAAPPRKSFSVAMVAFAFLLVLLGVGCAADQTRSPAPAAGQDTRAGPCTAEDDEYARSMGYGPANEAYEFALRIQEAVRVRNLDSLFGLVVEELETGPRKKFIQNKSFGEIFTEEWRQSILAEKPSCRPLGWRGHELANGSIWHSKLDDGRWTIDAIVGATEEALGHEAWEHDGKLLSRGCFTIAMPMSRENYDEYREKFGIGEELYGKPGRYIGGVIPLEPIITRWSRSLSLAVKLSACVSAPDSQDSKVADGWVHRKVCPDTGSSSECLNEVAESGSDVKRGPDTISSGCVDERYSAVRRVSLKDCAALAPHFPGACRDIQLVHIIDETGGSMGNAVNAVIYGIIDDPASKETYVVPLVNFGSLNWALNFVDDLAQ